MPTIRFRETPLIREILTIYKELRTKVMEDVHSSIIEVAVAQQGWGYTFGLTYKEGIIEGLEYPQPGGLSSLARQIQEQNHSKEIKRNCDYFNFVYNTCYQYIADNQNRYFGRANLNDIAHGKVIAMILLAHLCRRALEKPIEEQKKYKERIQRFTVELLKHKDIQSTSSQDDKLLSCKSALNRIFSASQQDNSSEQENKIDAYYQQIEETTRKLNELLVGIDNHMLPLFSAQNQIDVTHLQDLFKREGQATLTATEQRVMHDPFIVELFGRPTAALQKDDYLTLYKGLDYQLPKEGNFLWGQFGKEQQENLIKLLKLRDKLQVLQNELKKLHQFTSSNKISYFNDFIKLSEPYLKDIHHVKTELNVCLEKFEADCGKVYRERSKSPSSTRSLWETFYLNKQPLVEVRNYFINASRQISSAFASIPFDCFDALKEFSQEANEVLKRGYALFGDEFEAIDSHFQSDISQAQAKELSRQAELILVKQKSILAEYDELLLKARQSSDETTRKLIEILERRRAIIAQIIQTIELQSTDIAEEEGFVLIESSSFETKMLEEEHQTAGFLQIIRNYLSRPPVSTLEYNALREQLEKQGIELSEARKANATVQQDNQMKDELLSQQNELILRQDNEIKALTAEIQKRDVQLELVAGIANISILNTHNSQLLIKRVTNNQIAQVKELLTAVKNMQAIMQQGSNYEIAYESRASLYDSSLFFSHNNNGKKHARKIMNEWGAQLYLITNDAITQLLQNETIDAEKMSQLTKSLSNSLVDSMNDLIINENYSSYKQHSFRNYLRYFHQQLIVDGQLKETLTDKQVPIKDVNAIFATVNQAFNKTELEEFEIALQNQGESFCI
ncbi:Uncharacterised protein [Legionella steigerwaltii]|uniref:Uncharacterized protein n=1 Tax=Legionella steigerwaltii TaxID=460 RepID=A0A378L6G0_9GAMM|nr:hypothetical protein [Legionella steigerwaltii]KTD80324.1 hypothetical protein Lstg_0586 [Legionella steigerwaltii]STY22406.1 Uncharacterised protein [Legionella steigerwaltii]